MRRSFDDRARISAVLPLLRQRGFTATRGEARHLGGPGGYPGLHAQLRRSGGVAMTRYSQGELREIAMRAAVELDRAPAEKIVEWAADTFGERFCVTSSFADAVLAHVVSSVVPGVHVIFLDTGLHFAETLRVRDTVQNTLPVVVKSIKPRLSLAEQDAELGPRLYAREPDECC